MVEARTHIIIDYNRNGIVNQIALNGTDFKMGFIIAGLGAGALALALAVAPARLHWFSSSSRQQLPLSLATAAAAVVVVVEVTFNAIIYEFIFFAPPNRTLNAVWPDQSRTRPEQSTAENRTRDRPNAVPMPTIQTVARPYARFIRSFFADAAADAAACLRFRICKQTGQTNQTCAYFMALRIPFPVAVPVALSFGIGVALLLVLVMVLRLLLVLVLPPLLPLL